MIVWTPVRVAILARDIPGGVDTDEILRRLNAEEGPCITFSAMRNKTFELRLNRSAEFRKQRAKKAAAARKEHGYSAAYLARGDKLRAQHAQKVVEALAPKFSGQKQKPVIIVKPAPKPVVAPVAYAANAVTRAVKSGKTFSMLRD